MKLGATLYINNTLEAVEFYKEVFDLTLGYHEVFPDGTYMHAALLKGGNEVFAVSESRNEAMVNLMLHSTLEASRPTMCYGLSFETEEEVKRAYERLIEEGTILLPLGSLPWSTCCADVVDRYGIYWYLYV